MKCYCRCAHVDAAEMIPSMRRMSFHSDTELSVGGGAEREEEAALQKTLQFESLMAYIVTGYPRSRVR